MIERTKREEKMRRKSERERGRGEKNRELRREAREKIEEKREKRDGVPAIRIQTMKRSSVWPLGKRVGFKMRIPAEREKNKRERSVTALQHALVLLSLYHELSVSL